MPSSSEIRRCRPLLGTFVEVAAAGPEAWDATAAVDAAFDAVSQVHRAMSFHEPGSDVSRLNRLAADEPVAVGRWTIEVLEAAKRLYEETGGAFDVSVAPWLQRWGLLPGGREGDGDPDGGDASAIELLAGNRVRFRRPLRIDLGGIAKGFAVDRAVEVLRTAGASSGAVNAGGDLRLFGRPESTIHVRHPRDPGRMLPLLRLANGALATSAATFTRRRWRGRRVSALVDPLRRCPCTRPVSVSVQAPVCVTADALTKAVLVLGQRASEVLRAHSACAFLVTSAGRVTAIGGEP